MGVFAFCVSGGGSRCSNPSRDTGSKRLRNPQDEAPEGSNAPKHNVKTTASKQKGPAKGMDEISITEYVERRKINPYVNPLDIHEGILLVLDHIQINESLLLGPKQLSASEDSTSIHIRVDLPTFDVLIECNLVHALSRFLLLAGSGLDIALGGTRALWCFILRIAQSLGASVTTGIGMARATT